ncbi:hypothetical protein [Acidovorax sp.]|uniref:hypothetical protein n=1 Tax=Acidovorax sp. TaxID=1872122 RepID=UPI002632A87E|nr:hypothetical protein [Acidovorax sp.]
MPIIYSPSPTSALSHWPQQAAALAFALSALALTGCDRITGEPKAAPAAPSMAETDFDALVAACTQSVAGRTDSVRATEKGEWTKVGHSPALVQREVTRTESPITPYVGKIVIKDNEARATAPTEAEAQTITLTPAHLLSNRTHTFVYRFDGKTWHWNNGSRFTKTPSQSDTTEALSQADVSVPAEGFAGCLPR